MKITAVVLNVFSSLIRLVITSFNQLKEATKILLGVHPTIFFFSFTTETESEQRLRRRNPLGAH